MARIATNPDVIPAQAGTQYSVDSVVHWIPACSGITNWEFYLN